MRRQTVDGGLEHKIVRTHAAFDALVDRLGVASPQEADALATTIEELATTLEELEVVSEHLQEQNAELRATEQALVEQRQEFEDLFDLAPAASLVTDTEGVVRYANAEARDLLGGVAATQVVGRPLAVFVPMDARPGFRAGLTRAVDSVETVAWDFSLTPRGLSTILVTARVRHVRGDVGGETALRWALEDVTSARKAQSSLQTAFAHAEVEREQLRDLDRWKNAFLAAAAHDVRAPISTITGAAMTLMLRPELGTAQVQDLARAMRDQAGRLGDLLSDLLDLDRFSRGAVHAERAPTDVTALVREVAAEEAIEHHRLTVDAPPVTAAVDAPRVRQIVGNLVRNAARHTPPGTTIRVSLERQPELVVLVVEDDGPGVPDEIRDRIFSPFVTQAAHRGDSPGTGIGLSLVQLFAELHGGDARLEQVPGSGARFVVELPVPADV
jgi:PAS domain S-box-containing protein